MQAFATKGSDIFTSSSHRSQFAQMLPTRSLRPRVIAAAAAIMFIVTYLLYTNVSPPTTLPSGQKHDSLTQQEDPGLVLPLDPIPRRNFAPLAKFAPHNINEPSKFAYATFYCSRDPDPRGPYFEAAQSIIWRLLWSDYRSKYPIIVFVCPFIPEENRRILRGQGAIVKEVELLDNIIPDSAIATKRWIDVLSKLTVWKEVEWKRLVFLDSDAFPIRNMDEIFDLVQEQKCHKELLSPEEAAIAKDGKRGEEFCNYVYAGVLQFIAGNINAGLLVLKPNLDMHAKLLRAAKATNDYDVRFMEQGVLGSKNAFKEDGPFPVRILDPIWNAGPEYYLEYLKQNLEATAGPIRVLHSKMWNRFWGGWNGLEHLNDRWDLDWMAMCRFYDSNDFEQARTTGKFLSPLEQFVASQEKAKAAQKAAAEKAPGGGNTQGEKKSPVAAKPSQ